jgi:hypothetical protein
MVKQTKKKTATKKRGRIKTGKLKKPAQDMSAKDMKKVKGGLQQIQQTLNRVNETVTNLSRSQSDAEKSIAQNLSV